MSPTILQPRLTGKVALVTGAARGIGREIALRLASEGAAVGVLDLKGELAQETAEVIAQRGGRALAFAGNVAERASLQDAVAALEAEYGRLDILVNNAMWVRYGPLGDIEEKTVERMVGTGFSSIIWGMQAAAPAMLRAGGGSIINIASVAGYLAMPGALVYCGVKAGVMGLTRSAAAELGPQGIRVNAIAPGSVPTPGVAVNLDEAKMETRLARTPLRRLGRVEDIAGAAAFLASQDADFVTGEVLSVDGGITHAFN